jgi:hypothetical protein
MSFVRLSEQTDRFCVTLVESVYWAVRTESLYKRDMSRRSRIKYAATQAHLQTAENTNWNSGTGHVPSNVDLSLSLSPHCATTVRQLTNFTDTADDELHTN